MLRYRCYTYDIDDSFSSQPRTCGMIRTEGFQWKCASVLHEHIEKPSQPNGSRDQDSITFEVSDALIVSSEAAFSKLTKSVEFPQR